MLSWYARDDLKEFKVRMPMDAYHDLHGDIDRWIRENQIDCGYAFDLGIWILSFDDRESQVQFILKWL